jgi:hypothetical protein
MSSDFSNLALAFGATIALVSMLFGVHTWRKYKDAPMTREELLSQRVADLTATVRTLQRDHVDDTKRIEILEKKLFASDAKIARLEAEVEHYRAVLPAKVAYKPRKLSGEQMRVLRLALLDCYTSEADWSELLAWIDKNLDAVATGDNLYEIVAKVLAAANTEGWMAELLRAAAVNRPNNLALKALTDQLLTALGITP